MGVVVWLVVFWCSVLCVVRYVCFVSCCLMLFVVGCVLLFAFCFVLFVVCHSSSFVVRLCVFHV